MDEVFTPAQKAQLDRALPPHLISQRKGASNTTLSYIEGHDVIDQANTIFGYGNWAYRPLCCEHVVLIDPLTGEAVGIAYKAQVELRVRGCVAPIVEVGSQPVAAWNVVDTVMSRRKRGDTKPIEEYEQVQARRIIVEAHEQAEKGAVTDALKRALRTFGNQFGNSLYGADRTPVSHTQQGKALNEQIKGAKTRAMALRVARNAEEWCILLQHLEIPSINSAADVTKIEEYLDQCEQSAKSA